MSTLQKGTIWIAGCLTFVFALTAGMAWYDFGYLDWPTLGLLALMLAPLLATGALVVAWADKRAHEAQAPAPPLKRTAVRRPGRSVNGPSKTAGRA